MKSINQVWQDVVQRAPQARTALVPRLRKFLLQLDNPHARLLTGRLNEKPTDKSSALELQAWIVDEYRLKRLGKSDVAEWLRLIFDLISEYNRDSAVLFPTQLVDFVPPHESPFSPDSMASRLRVNLWRDALHNWVTSDNQKPDADAWVAAIVLSAALNGMLLDAAKLNLLVTKISQKERPDVTLGISSWIFDLPFQGLGNHNMQRWFLDPVSEMLIWRFLKAGIDIGEGSLRKKVAKFLVSQGVYEAHIPNGLTDMVAALRTWWSERSAPIDLHCATRSITTHAIHERTWSRLHGDSYQPRGNRLSRGSWDNDAQPEAFFFEDLLLLNPWLASAIEAINSDELTRVRAEVEAIHAEHSHGTQASVFVSWLLAMLQGFSAAKESLALSTIRRRFGAAAPRLLALLGEQNPVDMTTEQLEDYYSELTMDNEPLAPVRDIANGLRDFHAYLHKSYGKPLMRKEAEVLGDENALKPVDANLIAFDDYLKALDYLERQRGDKYERQICKLVLMLAFKVGMRRMEIFGLEVRDLQLHGKPVCVVRPNEKRRLKTQSSQRLLPLFALLSRPERQLLTDWVTQRMIELGPVRNTSTCDAYVFPQVGNTKHATWVERITDKVCSALREVTGDQQLFIHHLRHSFGTWTYLRLRAPDFPEITRHFPSLHSTVKTIREGKRLRILLLGRNPDVSRSYAFVVSRLLGHSSPEVSLGHYVHSADLLIGELARRECKQLPMAVLRSASGLRKSAAYEHIGGSIDQLILACRQSNRMENSGESGPTEPKKRGRKPRRPAHQRPEWIALSTIQRVLERAIECSASQSPFDCGHGFPKDRIPCLLAEAKQMAPLIGLPIDGHGNLTEGPSAIRGTAAQNFSKRLETLLADMSLRAPDLYNQGMSIYLKHFDIEKRDAVFRGAKDLKELKMLLRFLGSLGVATDEFSWMMRVLDTSASVLPNWAGHLDAKWQPSQIRAIRPKAANGALSYSQWVGIFPIDSDGQSLGLAMARTLFLARVADTAIKSTTPQSLNR